MALNTRQGLEAALADINDLIRRVQSQIASTENSNNFTAAEKAPRLAALRAELAGYQAQQAALTQQLNQLGPNNQSDGVTTAAAGPTPVEPGPGTTGTVATAPAPLKAGAAVYDPNTPYKVEVNGVGNTGVETVTKQAEKNAADNAQVLVKPQANVLDKFNSYTYQASVYLMSPTQYRTLLDSADRNIPDAQLLFQSGGASKRNKFFDNDFYIDSITLENVLAGKQTQSAHMTTTLKFTVTEPLGITLLDRLRDAVVDFSPTDASGKVNFSAAQFLMVIRFFGYDQNGKLVSPGIPEMAGNTIKPRAVIEKYIPFLITKINWSVGTKLVTYDIEAAPVGQTTGGSIGRGTVPFDIQITAGTIDEFFGGNVKLLNQETGEEYQSDAPPNAAAAPGTINQKVTRGIMTALNQFQQDLVKRNIYTIADTYEIEFVDANEIKQAILQLPVDKVDKKTSNSGQPATVSAASLDSNKVVTTPAKRSLPITAGQSLTQVIDLIIRNSSYINGQAAVTSNPDGEPDPAEKPPQNPMKWFMISYSARPIGDKIDPKRNDYAYNIKYTITKYEVPNFDSTYFPVAAYPGLHKEYKYWFTGENTAVLDYSASYDALYNITVSGTKPGDSAQDARRRLLTSSARDIAKYAYSPRSTQGVGYGDGKSNESSANAAEYLYSPDTLHSSRLRIVGDPAWIQQGSLFKPIDPATFKAEAKLGFMPDGTISFDSAQVLYEIAWQRPEDYDIKTGLADPYAKTFKKYGQREPLQSNIYQALKVVSEFRGGRFEQTIEGALYLYSKPQASITVRLGENESNAETNKLARQGNPQAQTASQAAAAANSGGSLTAFGSGANNPSLTSAAAGVSGTVAAPPLNTTTTNGSPDSPEVAAAQSVTESVADIVPSRPSTPVTSNGQTVSVGGYGFGIRPPNVLPGRTTLNELQAGAQNTPPQLTRIDA
jgi:hypothetical protein